MTDFTITAMSIIDAEPNPAGGRVLASYDLSLAGMRLTGCILTADAEGLVSARGIRGKTPKGVKVGAQITCPDLQDALTRRVAETYMALTGRRVEVG